VSSKPEQVYTTPNCLALRILFGMRRYELFLDMSQIKLAILEGCLEAQKVFAMQVVQYNLKMMICPYHASAKRDYHIAPTS